MAVTRIVASGRWHRAAAATMADHKRCARELLRAAERPGLLAELCADEIRVLAERLPNDRLVTEALDRLEASERRERDRPRPQDLVARRRERLGEHPLTLVSEPKWAAASDRQVNRQKKEGVHVAATTIPASSSSRRRRSAQDWEDLARELLPELQNGRSIADFDDRIGSNSDALRTALAKLGYDPHGEPMKLREITGRTPKTLAGRVARRRRDGAPWWLLVAETEKSYGDLTRLLTDNGFSLSGEPVADGAGSAE